MNNFNLLKQGLLINPFLTIASFLTLTAAACILAEYNNELEYENRPARMIAGFIKILMRIQHGKLNQLPHHSSSTGRLISIGPHRTGWEAMMVASQMKGPPPQFFGTDSFKMIPGVSVFYEMFKVIVIESKATKKASGESANYQAIQKAKEVLQNKGCIAIFPQGSFSRIGQSPRRIYDGIARIAIQNQVPIEVIRLDGFWCLQNPWIPLMIRNNVFYRAFVSFFHMNNVKVHQCAIIDYHLKSENKDLSEQDKIDEINAQLFAYYRHTEELTPLEIKAIGEVDISQKKHGLFWKQKKQEDQIAKEIEAHLKTS